LPLASPTSFLLLHPNRRIKKWRKLNSTVEV
jgi:hypothetical protein